MKLKDHASFRDGRQDGTLQRVSRFGSLDACVSLALPGKTLLDPDRFDIYEFAYAELAQLAAVTRILYPAKRQTRI